MIVLIFHDMYMIMLFINSSRSESTKYEASSGSFFTNQEIAFKSDRAMNFPSKLWTLFKALELAGPIYGDYAKCLSQADNSRGKVFFFDLQT